MEKKECDPIPEIVQETIDRVIQKMRYRKTVRTDVRAELEAHFEDALAECLTTQTQRDLAEKLIAEFGDTKVLGDLIRRAKKRCRPLWIKAMIRTGQVAGLCVLYIILCLSRLMIGSPTVKIDTIAAINELEQQGREEALNAFPGVEKAIALLGPKPQLSASKYPNYQEMNALERQIADTYVAKNQEALDMLREAVQKPYYWRLYNPVPLGLGDTGVGMVGGRAGLVKNAQLSSHLSGQVMPELPKYRELAFALKYQSLWYGAWGQAGPALQDALAIIRLGHLTTGEGLLTEQLMGVAMTSLGGDTILSVVSQLDVNEPLLTETSEALESLFDRGALHIDYRIERAIVDDMIQRSFTDDGQGNGRPLSSAVFYLGDSPADWWKNLLLFDYPDRRQVVQHLDGFYQDLNRWQTLTPWARRDQGYALTHTEISTMYTAMTKPALERSGELGWHLKVHMQAVLAVLAIKRYQTRHGVLPETLQALVADGLMKALPRDFYSDGPLSYQRKSDTDFVLYSWGEDLKDDGGVPSTNADGQIRKFGTNGDWIFWPVLR